VKNSTENCDAFKKDTGSERIHARGTGDYQHCVMVCDNLIVGGIISGDKGKKIDDRGIFAQKCLRRGGSASQEFAQARGGDWTSVCSCRRFEYLYSEKMRKAIGGNNKSDHSSFIPIHLGRKKETKDGGEGENPFHKNVQETGLFLSKGKIGKNGGTIEF